MTNKASIMLACAAALALALAATAGAQAPPSAPQAKVDDDKVVLSNEHVTVWFQGKKPMLKVFPSGNESAGYGYVFTDVLEYRDLDANGVPSKEEVVSRLDLVKASGWEVETTEAEGEVVLNLTLTAPVKLAGGVLQDQDVQLPERDATVGLTFTLRSEDVVVDAQGVNVTVPRTSVKYDFAVLQWPFVDADANRLALDARVQGALDVDEEAALGSATVDANGTSVGALSWTLTAAGTLADGTEVDVPVKAHVQADGNATRLVYTYDAAGLATLLHDPTLGVLSTALLESAGDEAGALADLGKAVPGPALPLAAAGAGVAALALRRGRHG